MYVVVEGQRILRRRRRNLFDRSGLNDRINPINIITNLGNLNTGCSVAFPMISEEIGRDLISLS